MATTKKVSSTKSPTAKVSTRPTAGFCHHMTAKRYDCSNAVPTEHPNWTWCAEHVAAHRAASRKPTAAKPLRTVAKATSKVVTHAPAPERIARRRVPAQPVQIAALVALPVTKAD